MSLATQLAMSNNENWVVSGKRNFLTPGFQCLLLLYINVMQRETSNSLNSFKVNSNTTPHNIFIYIILVKTNLFWLNFTIRICTITDKFWKIKERNINTTYTHTNVTLCFILYIHFVDLPRTLRVAYSATLLSIYGATRLRGYGATDLSCRYYRICCYYHYTMNMSKYKPFICNFFYLF